MDLKYPQWQVNPQHLREKVQRAEEAIAKRIEELALEQGELPSEILTCVRKVRGSQTLHWCGTK